MTWSIIARDEKTGRIGIAVATRFFAVGALVPHIRTGVGAIASQALMNPYYGPNGLSEVRGYPSPARVPSAALDAAAAVRLWRVSEEMTSVAFPA